MFTPCTLLEVDLVLHEDQILLTCFFLGMTPTNIVRVNMFVAATGGLPASEITFAELAKKQGYATALIGRSGIEPTYRPHS